LAQARDSWREASRDSPVCCVIDLKAVINRFFAEHNSARAKPFFWRADSDAFIASQDREFQGLESIH
jgi:hypothetical protein